MGSKTRGREKLIICSSCGRRVPRSKAVFLDRPVIYSTDLKTEDDIRSITWREQSYCPSCAKHRHIYQKKKMAAARNRAGGY